MAKRFKRFARAAMGPVRNVLKRVRGGLSHRHMEEVSDCAPAITARCHAEKADDFRGRPNGKPVNFLSSPIARDISARRRGALSFQTQIHPSRAIDNRHAGHGFDLMRQLPLKTARPKQSMARGS